MKQLQLFYKEERRFFFSLFLLMLVQSFGTLLLPYFLAKIIDEGILKVDTTAIWHNGWWMFAIAIGTVIVSVGGSYLSAHLSGKFGHFLRMRLFKKTQELSVSAVDGYGTPTLLARTTSDINNIQQILMMALQMILPAPMIVAASIFLTGTVSLRMIWVPIVAILCFSLIAYGVIRKAIPLSQITQKLVDKMMRILRETFTGARVIRAFDKAAYEKERTDQTLTEYAKTMIQVNRLFAVLNPTVNLVMGLSISTILVYGGYQSLQGHLAIGSITAIIEYTILSLWFLTMAAMVIVMVPKGLTSLQRIEEVLEEPIDLIDGDQTLNKTAELETIAAFNQVQFTYEGAEEPVLEDISFEIHRGKTTAIVGGTGSGKSTIAKALLRFKDVTAGSITLFDHNIKEISQAELRDQISYVPQKALLLSGTIQETLRFGNRPATHEAMAKAAEVAQAKSFIEGLPENYNSPVAQKGSNFSGGQKQRLSIARALTKPAEIYFFDDSFSALDYQTDANLRRALKEYTKDAAVIIVAQRVSTVKNADQIIVLDNGKMVGKGTHEELLRNCQTYQEFASSQGMGGMKDE